MTKRNKQYKPRGTSVPMLVNRLVNDNVESMEEFGMLTAFQYGVATIKHYDYLVRMANMMNIANQTKPSDLALSLVTNLNWLASAILERYNAHGKFGLSAQELSLMRKLVLAYDSYWKAQTTTLYNNCAYELNAFTQYLPAA